MLFHPVVSHHGEQYLFHGCVQSIFKSESVLFLKSTIYSLNSQPYHKMFLFCLVCKTSLAFRCRTFILAYFNTLRKLKLGVCRVISFNALEFTDEELNEGFQMCEQPSTSEEMDTARLTTTQKVSNLRHFD